MSAGLEASPEPLCTAFDLALMDVDGVCLRGTAPVGWAAETLREVREAGQRVMFVTNNASREPQVVTEELVGAGIGAETAEVTTAAQAAAALLSEELPGGSVLAVGGPGLRTALIEAGFTLVDSADDRPDAVVQGLAMDLGWAELTEAALAVRAGARYLATNLDATLPRERGLALGNGSLVAAVTHATGVTPASAGKPAAAIFHQAAARAGGRRPIVVGDRLDTDLAGARAAGYPGLHVLTGVNDARDVVLASAEQRPSFLGADLRALTEPHPAPRPEPGGWWRCGDSVAGVSASGLLQLRTADRPVSLDGGAERGAEVATITLDAWRCLAAASWAGADDGRPLHREALPLLQVEPAR